MGNDNFFATCVGDFLEGFCEIGCLSDNLFRPLRLNSTPAMIESPSRRGLYLPAACSTLLLPATYLLPNPHLPSPISQPHWPPLPSPPRPTNTPNTTAPPTSRYHTPLQPNQNNNPPPTTFPPKCHSTVQAPMYKNLGLNTVQTNKCVRNTVQAIMTLATATEAKRVRMEV